MHVSEHYNIIYGTCVARTGKEWGERKVYMGHELQVLPSIAGETDTQEPFIPTHRSYQANVN